MKFKKNAYNRFVYYLNILKVKINTYMCMCACICIHIAIL